MKIMGKRNPNTSPFIHTKKCPNCNSKNTESTIRTTYDNYAKGLVDTSFQTYICNNCGNYFK